MWVKKSCFLVIVFSVSAVSLLALSVKSSQFRCNIRGFSLAAFYSLKSQVALIDAYKKVSQPCRFAANANFQQRSVFFREYFERFEKRQFGNEKRIRASGVDAWIYALVAGDKSFLSSRDVERIKQTNLYHVVVVSGAHVGSLYLLFRTILVNPLHFFGAMFLPFGRVSNAFRLFLGAFALWGVLDFALASGFGPPAQRAVLVLVLHGINKRFGWFGVNWPLFFCAVLLQSLLFPAGVASLSFMLSWAYFLVIVGSASCSAWVVCEMQLLTVAVSGSFSLVGLALNFLVMPLLPFLMFLALLRIVCTDGFVGVAVGRFLESLLISFDLVSVNSDFVFTIKSLNSPVILVIQFVAISTLLNSFRKLTMNKLANKQ